MPPPNVSQTLQVQGSPNNKIVLTDRDYSKIIKAETRRHQLELAGQYGAMINNKQFVDQASVCNDSVYIDTLNRNNMTSMRSSSGSYRRRGHLSSRNWWTRWRETTISRSWISVYCISKRRSTRRRISTSMWCSRTSRTFSTTPKKSSPTLQPIETSSNKKTK